jgi:uncharacterized protein YkwD
MNQNCLRRIAGLAASACAILTVAAPAANATPTRTHHTKHSAKAHHAHAATAGRANGAGASCANADTPAAGAAGATMSAAVLCLVNRQRTNHGLPALHANPRLDRSAQSWTNSMVHSGVFSHGSDFSGRIDAVGYDWSAAGENIATGYSTPHQVVTAWMASPEHCRNILNPGYADVGTGVLGGGIGAYGPSTWTQDFGLWMGHSAPSSDSGPMNACPSAGH